MIEAPQRGRAVVPAGRRRRTRARGPGARLAVLVFVLLLGGVLLSALTPLLPAERAAPAAVTGARAGHARPSAATEPVSLVPAAAPSHRVWVQGDSVMVAAADTVHSALQADGWKAVVTGWPGLHLWAANQLFAQVRPQMGSVAVVELGDNDCCNAQSFGRDIDRTMQILSGMHVIWLTGTADRAGQPATEAAIRAAPHRWPNLEVADWAAVVALHPDAVFPDGVHLTPTGQNLMASFLRGLLDGWYRRATRPPAAVARAFGTAPVLAPAAGVPVGAPVAGGSAAPGGGGCWLVGADGGVFSFGDARFFGSAAGRVLGAPVVGMAATPDGGGYWLVGADGGVLTFGDARFFGSAAGRVLGAPVVGMAATPDGGGYWLVGADGGVLTFGDARFFGSAAGRVLGAPVVGMAATPDGGGYWLVGADGGVLTFGDAPFGGSLGGTRLASPVRSVAAPPGGGYWLADAAGRVYPFGGAPADDAVSGTVSAAPLSSAVIVARPGGGYWLVGEVAAGQ